MLKVVLYQPLNPHNTGAIARTCAMLGAQLHLVRPLGFEVPNRDLRRASMDYVLDTNITVHDSWDAFKASLKGAARLWLFTDAAQQTYCEVAFESEDYLVFGRESDGIPASILETHACLSIPMRGASGEARTDHRFHSLNVSVSAAIALSEALRQLHAV